MGFFRSRQSPDMPLLVEAPKAEERWREKAGQSPNERLR
jgi:hypothetical protein